MIWTNLSLTQEQNLMKQHTLWTYSLALDTNLLSSLVLGYSKDYKTQKQHVLRIVLILNSGQSHDRKNAFVAFKKFLKLFPHIIFSILITCQLNFEITVSLSSSICHPKKFDTHCLSRIITKVSCHHYITLKFGWCYLSTAYIFLIIHLCIFITQDLNNFESIKKKCTKTFSLYQWGWISR